ncbi:MAG: hypothetical protein AAF288_02790 [Planctomycetota bacterium]
MTGPTRRTQTRGRRVYAGLAGVLWLTCAVGCAKTYVGLDPDIDAKVVVEAKYDAKKRVLSTKSDADIFPIYGVAIRDAQGDLHNPIVATRGPRERRGGVNLGVGLGIGIPIGSVSVGPGIGLGAPIGGRIVPGPVNARFNQPPADLQPWTLVVILETEPPRTVLVPLGKVDKSEDLPPGHDYGQDAVRIETWKLVDGSEQRFVVLEPQGEPPGYQALSEDNTDDPSS